MQRTCMAFLKNWLVSSRRKPLVMRGARQVGKTWIVRHLAESEGMKLVEFNFEKTPAFAALFESNSPQEIIKRIEQRFSLKIDPKKTLLFLDEIQAKPELLAKLRWFYEDMPELPVVAAGSLLEFFLSTLPISMPVGRVSYVYLEPLSFIEFLEAQKKEQLIDLIKTYAWNDEINSVIHHELMRLFKEYIYVGGLPEAVSSWIQERSLDGIRDVHRDLLGSYRADFSKYIKKISSDTLNEVIDAIPLFLGKKFVYSHVDSTANSQKIKEALNLLCQARVGHKVKCTAANGVPLGAEINSKFLKAILLDVGLSSAVLDLKLSTLEDINELDMVNKGGIAEQAAGQLLRTIEPFNVEPALYYWVRNERGSDAEIDYVIQHTNRLVPIEVKAGNTGTLKSLHLFMKLKELSTAIRIYSGQPRIDEVRVKDNQGNDVSYQLRSIPFYLISEIHRLLSD
ncbi:MAG: AAA family ATPase [Parachlamydia sp.]|nr:AAA family ATPase [Parachlamydia sp.]